MEHLDITKQNEIDETQEERNMLHITYDDLLFVSSGETDSGTPSSVVTVVIDRIDRDGRQVTDMQIILQSGVSTFFASGGCLVLQVDFPRTGSFEYQRAVEIISTYLNNASLDEDYVEDHAFGVVVVPMVLEGLVSLVLQDIVYFTGFDLPDYGKRLIMCFNDLQTEVLETGSEIDFKLIEQQVRAQLQRESNQIQAEIEEMQAELKELNEQNPYAQRVQEQYQHNADIVHNQNQVIQEPNKYIRSSRE